MTAFGDSPARQTSSSLIDRPDLSELLEAGMGGRVTSVVAPAGSGKTVLVRTWLESRAAAEPIAWVTVERGERDPQRFWSGLVGEIGSATALQSTVEAMEPTPGFNAEAVIGRLVGDLTGMRQRLVLVIDDLQEISSDEILGQLKGFLNQLPRQVHVVVISRHAPQLDLHRRRLEGELSEIRNHHLRFTVDQTRQMLSAVGIALSEESVTLLHDRTEGWVAGLRLAALSLATHPDPNRFVVEFSGSDRTVAEYLIAEVLDRQPREVRRLLVNTSILERVNGALGDLLTGNTASESHLKSLADTGAFVIALDTRGDWYRVHHLFADLLAGELRHASAQEIAQLHLAAAGWYAEHGYVLEAIGHALAADDQDQVARLLGEHYFSLMLDGRQATARVLVDAAIRRFANPELAVVVAADELIRGSLDQAAAQLEFADRHARDVPEDRRARFELMWYVTRLSLARRVGDFQSVLDVPHPAALYVQPNSPEDIARQYDTRAMMLMNLGIVEVWTGRREDGEQHLIAAEETARQIGRPYLEASCQAHRAQSLSWRSFVAARRAAEEALTVVEGHGWQDDPIAGAALVVQGTCLAMAGRLGEAEMAFQRADVTLRSELEPAVGFQLQMGHGLVNFVKADYPQSIKNYLQAERLGMGLATSSPLALQSKCAMLASTLAGGDIAFVRAALEDLTEIERESGEAREVIATLSLSEGDAQAALVALEPTVRHHVEVHHKLVLVRSLLLEARARMVLGETSESEGAVERALELAEADELILPFLYIDSAALLKSHPRHRTSHGGFMTEILDVLSGRQMGGRSQPSSSTILALSSTELRVLRFLPTNLSAAGIASEMYVSVNTVKTHMRNIYAKLDAHSRTEAVEQARRMGLLGGWPRAGS